MDYKREDGRFPVSASYVTNSNPDFPSSSGTVLNRGTAS
jgi:hypothetical protein